MKYKLTDEYIVTSDNKKLYRIKRNSDGLLGGYVESMNNLSQHGNCFAFNDAKIFGNAKVEDDAQIYGQVFGNSRVYGKAIINGQVFGNAEVGGEVVVNSQVFGNAKVTGNSVINNQVFGNVIIN